MSGQDIQTAEAFICAALTAKIAEMLEDLGNPELVGRIYPDGWRNENSRGLTQLYELCRRTFAQRERANG